MDLLGLMGMVWGEIPFRAVGFEWGWFSRELTLQSLLEGKDRHPCSVLGRGTRVEPSLWGS